MQNRCFKCLKPIPEGEIVCDSKYCREALKEMSKELNRIVRREYRSKRTNKNEKEKSVDTRRI